MKTDWEKEELEKLLTVMKAASLNPPSDRRVKVETTGFRPHASAEIQEHVLRKFIHG